MKKIITGHHSFTKLNKIRQGKVELCQKMTDIDKELFTQIRENAKFLQIKIIRC